MGGRSSNNGKNASKKVVSIVTLTTSDRWHHRAARNLQGQKQNIFVLVCVILLFMIISMEEIREAYPNLQEMMNGGSINKYDNRSYIDRKTAIQTPYNNHSFPPLASFSSMSKFQTIIPANATRIDVANWTIQEREDYVTYLSRQIAIPYTPINVKDICQLPPTSNFPAGLLYVKVPKAASTTLSSINRRIAIRQGQRQNYTNAANISGEPCPRNDIHILNVYKYYGHRNRSRSFLWGSVRDPASRALSRYFYYFVTQARHNASDDAIVLKFLTNHSGIQIGCTSRGHGGFQLRYLTTAPEPIPEYAFWTHDYPTLLPNITSILHHIQQYVFHDYQFMAISERMDESLTMLQLLLNIPLGDILMTSSKVNGSFIRIGKGATQHCRHIEKSFRSPAVHAYLTSAEYYAANFGDLLIHKIANIQLDLTIDHVIGRKRFESALQNYRKAQKLIKEICDPIAIFPCSSNGTLQVMESKENCYNHDEGCGYPCIDEVVELHEIDDIVF